MTRFHPRDLFRKTTVDDVPDFHTELSRYFRGYYIDTRNRAVKIDYINILRLPPMVERTIEFLRHGFHWMRPPGMRPILHLCIVQGLALISKHPAIEAIQQARRALYNRKQTGTPQEEYITQLLSQKIKAEIPDDGTRHTVAVLPEVRTTFCQIREDISTDESSLACICVYSYLQTQEGTPPKYSEEMRDKVAAFFSCVQSKAAAVTAMIEDMERGKECRMPPFPRDETLPKVVHEIAEIQKLDAREGLTGSDLGTEDQEYPTC